MITTNSAHSILTYLFSGSIPTELGSKVMDTLTHALFDREQTNSGDKAGWLWADWRKIRRTRKPTLLFRLFVLFLLRAEERIQGVLLFHEPPRMTRQTLCSTSD